MKIDNKELEKLVRYISLLTNTPHAEEDVQRCSVKKVFLEISQNSQENTYARVSFFNKVASLRSTTLLKKRLWHRCFPVNFVRFLRTPFFIEHLRWLLLHMFWDSDFLVKFIPWVLRTYVSSVSVNSTCETKKWRWQNQKSKIENQTSNGLTHRTT